MCVCVMVCVQPGKRKNSVVIVLQNPHEEEVGEMHEFIKYPTLKQENAPSFQPTVNVHVF